MWFLAIIYLTSLQIYVLNKLVALNTQLNKVNLNGEFRIKMENTAIYNTKHVILKHMHVI